METRGKIIIVGGGIAGILSAFLYQSKGFEVVLIEKSSEIGGLLRSQELFEKKLFFDFGTHFLKETGIEEVDHFLFEGLDKSTLPYLKSGTFFNSLYNKNGFLSEESLSEVQKAESFKEFIKASHNPNEGQNMYEQAYQLFGEGYAEGLILPAVEKLYSTSAKFLVKGAHKIFGLSRIILSNKELTKELKKNPEIDAVIAYQDYTTGQSALSNFYPKKGGVGSWVQLLKEKLVKQGVEIITSSEISNMSCKKGIIVEVEIGRQKFSVEKVVWTIPLFFLLKKLPSIDIKLKPTKRLNSLIFHFIVPEKYLTDLYYIQVFDPKLKSFRVTLYDNFSESIHYDKFRISVELLSDVQYESVELLQNEIFNELIYMGVLRKGLTYSSFTYNSYPNSFPVLSQDFINNSEEMIASVRKEIKNIELYGKANGKTWFMNDVIHEVYDSIS
jgi:protoporphyrinogen oxidase